MKRLKFSWEALALLGLVLVIWLIHRDYGPSYDEAVHVNNGDWIMAWYATGGRVDAAVTAISSRYYSGLADVPTQMVANLGTMLFGWDLYEMRHLVTALLGMVGIVYAYRLGRLLWGPAAGWWAGAFLFLTPRWFGHMFDDPKDIPFASAYLATLFYTLRPLQHGRQFELRDCVKLGAALGAALGVRIGGVFLLAPIIGALCAAQMAAGTVGGDFKRVLRTVHWGRLARQILIVGGVGWLLMVVCWPYALISPFTRPLEVMAFMAHNPWEGNVFFHGQVIPASEIPRQYLARWLMISLPEFYFFGLGFGLLALLLAIRRQGWVKSFPITGLVLALGVVIPFAVITLLRSPLYDGMRHCLFLVPPLAVLAAGGVAGVWASSFRWMAIGMVTAGMLLAAFDLATLHPYETIYFNRLFGGGVARGLRQYDGDYWGQTYYAGVNWIVDHYPSGQLTIGVPYMAKRLGYELNRPTELAARRSWLWGGLHGHFQARPPAMPRLRAVGPDWDGVASENPSLFDQRQFQLYLSGVQFHANERVAGRTVFTVRRCGVTLLEIKEVDSKPPAGN